jgi:hypothetical protein
MRRARRTMTHGTQVGRELRGNRRWQRSVLRLPFLTQPEMIVSVSKRPLGSIAKADEGAFAARGRRMIKRARRRAMAELADYLGMNIL